MKVISFGNEFDILQKDTIGRSLRHCDLHHLHQLLSHVSEEIKKHLYRVMMVYIATSFSLNEQELIQKRLNR